MAIQPDEAGRIFEQLVESAPDAVIVIDASGTIQLINGQVEQLFGYTRVRLIGAPLELLMPERFRSHHASKRARWEHHPVTGTLGAGLDLVGLRSDGTEFPVDIRVSSVETGSRRLTVGIVRDATGRRRDIRVLPCRGKQIDDFLQQFLGLATPCSNRAVRWSAVNSLTRSPRS